MTADKIKAARALIEPLTGHTQGPWWTEGQETTEHWGRDGRGAETTITPSLTAPRMMTARERHEVMVNSAQYLAEAVESDQARRVARDLVSMLLQQELCRQGKA